MLPRTTLFEHLVGVAKCSQQMNVIRHHDEIGQFISVAVEVFQAVGDNVSQFHPSQHTLTVAFVEFIMPSLREGLMEFALEPLVQLSQSVFPM